MVPDEQYPRSQAEASTSALEGAFIPGSSPQCLEGRQFCSLQKGEGLQFFFLLTLFSGLPVHIAPPYLPVLFSIIPAFHSQSPNMFAFRSPKNARILPPAMPVEVLPSPALVILWCLLPSSLRGTLPAHQLQCTSPCLYNPFYFSPLNKS